MIRLPTRFTWCCLGLAMTIAAAACGGASERTPTGPTVTTPPAPTAPPAPTPTQRTLTLDAASDHFQYSIPLAGLQPGEALDVAVRPLTINTAAGERFGHTVGLWVFSGRDPLVADSSTDGIAIVLGWTASGWIVTSRTPVDQFRSTNRLVQIPLGETRRLRVVRTNDATVQFGLEGETMFTLSQALKTAFVFAQVVGARAEFSYLAQPGGVTGELTDLAWTSSRMCTLCIRIDQ